jgi:PAS domain S-box-containing protein
VVLYSTVQLLPVLFPAITAMPGIFYIFGQNGKFVRWNRNLEAVTGYTAAEIARQTPFDHLREDCKT